MAELNFFPKKPKAFVILILEQSLLLLSVVPHWKEYLIYLYIIYIIYTVPKFPISLK